eukprot:6193631-Pleurochrysis_carterae.AAC.4
MEYTYCTVCCTVARLSDTSGGNRGGGGENREGEGSQHNTESTHIGQELLANGNRMIILRWATQNPRNGRLRSPEAYILVRGAFTSPYLAERGKPDKGLYPSFIWETFRTGGEVDLNHNLTVP